MNFSPRLSLTRRTLLRIAATAALGIAVATLVTALIVYRALEALHVRLLDQYAVERARREETPFLIAEKKHRVFVEAFRTRWQGPSDPDFEARFNAHFAQDQEGAWRSRRELVDPSHQASTWIRAGSSITPELKRLIMLCHDLCEEFFPLWQEEVSNLYLTSPFQFNAGIDPRLPEWVWEIAADFDQNQHEWCRIASQSNNPERQQLWTGITPDPSAPDPADALAVATLCTPIDVDGRHLVTLHLDVELEGVLEEAARSERAGITHLIFRDDGRLIAAPDKETAIIAGGGRLTMQDSGDPRLQSLYAAVTSNTASSFTGYDDRTHQYFAASRLRGPDWWFVSVLPQAQLRAEAFRSAQWVLWIGLASVGFNLFGLSLILRREISRPLRQLLDATRRIASGQNGRLENIPQGTRQDELGVLAAAFDEMAHRVASRDAELRAERDSLEQRVQDRTAELRASEARLRALVEHAPEAIVVWDGDTGLFVEANENALRLYGVDRERIVTLSPVDVSPPAQPDGRLSSEAVAEVLERALTNDRLPMYEWMHRDRHGREFPCEVRVARVSIPGRNLFIGTIIDIAERKAAEAQLTLLATIVERMNDHVGVTDLDGRMVYINPAGRSLLGVEMAEEIIGKSFLDHYTHASAELVRQRVVDQVMQTGAWSGEISYRHRKGEEIPVAMNAMLIRDRTGQPQYLAAISRDRRPLLQAERAVRESEARYRALFDNSGVAVMVHDEHQILEANAAALRIGGATSPEQVIGKHPGELSPPFQPNGEPSSVAAQEHIARVLTDGRSEFEWLGRRIDGSTFPCQVMLTRLQLGGRTLIQACVTDQTEVKRAQTELLKALERERELGELKTNFISMVSHEFRTPLEIVVSSVDILDRYFERLSRAERTEHLSAIRQAVKRMSGMMENVLLLGRFENARQQFRPDDVHLTGLCRRVIDEMRSATTDRCPIDFTLADDLPLARVDENLVRHILTNLLSNAVKYSPADQAVTLQLTREKSEAVIVVCDHGLGIPAEDQARLFDAFHRGQNTGQIPGTGLGLVIVKRSVELHGGRIAFTSEEGKGTEFIVRLPAFEPSDS